MSEPGAPAGGGAGPGPGPGARGQGGCGARGWQPGGAGLGPACAGAGPGDWGARDRGAGGAGGGVRSRPATLGGGGLARAAPCLAPEDEDREMRRGRSLALGLAKPWLQKLCTFEKASYFVSFEAGTAPKRAGTD